MMKVYGTPLCKDCLAMKIMFAESGVEYQFVNITENTVNLREFLKIREEEPMFQDYRENAGIGVPCFVKGDKKTFDINTALTWEGKTQIPEAEIRRITEECELLLQ